MTKAPKKADPLIPNGLQHTGTRQPPTFPGIDKLCGNCQHFRPKVTGGRDGTCHNGISGRIKTRRIDGCAYGFYPSIVKFPLVAGPGGVHEVRPQS